MTRRLLVAAIWMSAAAAWAQGKVATVGVLNARSAADYATNLDQLRKGLLELGYVEGRNLKIEARHADGKLERLPQLATELAAVPVDVLVTAGSHVTRVARKATRDVPIVLWNPDVPERVIQFKETRAAAASLRIAAHSFEVRRAEEIDPALKALAAKRPGAVIVMSDALTSANFRTIAAFAAKHKLVTVYQERPGVQLGGLFSYGASFPGMHYRAATYVDKILKGARPGDLPIEQPTQFELVINLKTAKTLGIRIPASVLARADTVIE